MYFIIYSFYLGHSCVLRHIPPKMARSKQQTLRELSVVVVFVYVIVHLYRLSSPLCMCYTSASKHNHPSRSRAALQGKLSWMNRQWINCSCKPVLLIIFSCLPLHLVHRVNNAKTPAWLFKIHGKTWGWVNNDINGNLWVKSWENKTVVLYLILFF